MSLRISEIPSVAEEAKFLAATQVKQYTIDVQKQRLTSRIQTLAQSEKNIQTPISPQQARLSMNIILEWLGRNNLNYTYNMFLKETLFPLQQKMQTQAIKRLLGIKETDRDIRKHFLQQFTVVDLMIETLQSNRVEKIGTTTQTFEVEDSMKTEDIFNRRYEAMREELEKIYEQQYEIKIKEESRKEPAEIKSIKESLQREFEEEYSNRYKAKSKLLEIKQDSLNRKQSEFIILYNNKIDQLTEESHLVKAESKAVRERLKEALAKEKQHCCLQSEEFKKELQSLGVQRERLRKSEYEYRMALSNLNTNMQDVIQKKQALLCQNQASHNIESQRRLKLDDNTIKKLLQSMSSMEQRVDIMAKQNMQYMKTKEQSIKKIKQLEDELRSTRGLYLQEQEIVNRTIELRDRHLHIAKKTIGVSVTEEEIQSSLNNTTQEHIQKERKELDDLIEQSNSNRLEHLNNMDRIRLEMTFIKQKIRDISESDIE